MPFAPARSLLNPYGPEPLPLYTPRQTAPQDTETASVRSSAPSYVSAAPSYHSSAPPHHIRASDLPSAPDSNATEATNFSTGHPESSGSGLPPAQNYAPGYENRCRQSNTPSIANLRSFYNTAEWVPATGGLQARHYHNVARRRATEGANSLGNMSVFPALMNVISSPGPSSRFDSVVNFPRRFTAPSVFNSATGLTEQSYNASSSDLNNNPLLRTASPQAMSTATLTEGNTMMVDNEEDIPFSPHEDPDLVGEEAAARARSQRLYITYQQQENQIQSQPLSSGARPQEPRHTHVYQYSSLISPPSTPHIHRFQSTTPPNDNNTAAAAPSLPQSQPRTQSRTQRPSRDPDEALRAQEAATWDFMLAQMASWEERERGWKRFRDDVDRRLAHSGLRIGLGFAMNGKRKQRKESYGGSGSGGAKKWKSRVGLTT